MTTVEELIAQLQKLPKDLPVEIRTGAQDDIWNFECVAHRDGMCLLEGW